MKVAILLTMAENESKWLGYNWCWRAILTTIQVYNLVWKEVNSYWEPEIIFVKAVGRTGAMGGTGVEWPASIWHWDILAGWRGVKSESRSLHCLSLVWGNRQNRVRLHICDHYFSTLGTNSKVSVVELATTANSGELPDSPEQSPVPWVIRLYSWQCPSNIFIPILKS